jgi:hypothetical protein
MQFFKNYHIFLLLFDLLIKEFEIWLIILYIGINILNKIMMRRKKNQR